MGDLLSAMLMGMALITPAAGQPTQKPLCGRVVAGTIHPEKQDRPYRGFTFELSVVAKRDGLSLGIRNQEIRDAGMSEYNFIKHAEQKYLRAKQTGQIGAEGGVCLYCKNPESVENYKIPCDAMSNRTGILKKPFNFK
ncbi:hypothetical protein GOV11_03865 [Candidatus Woesearchaeota archaeon]|nr:hypothetical protein [Candidatus Woesearchaeota archaeon]